MKAAVFVVVWLALGVAVAARTPRPSWERALCAAFWPFFLAADLAGTTVLGPVDRLRAALAPDDPAQRLVADLAAAIARQVARVDRLEHAVAGTQAGSGSAGALEAARGTSRDLLVSALARERTALADTLAAVEVTATRLWLLRESGDRDEIDRLVADLASRLQAGEEVAAPVT